MTARIDLDELDVESRNQVVAYRVLKLIASMLPGCDPADPQAEPIIAAISTLLEKDARIRELESIERAAQAFVDEQNELVGDDFAATQFCDLVRAVEGAVMP